MMGLPLALGITLLAICVVLLVLIVRLIGRGRLQIRYSLLWLALVVVMILCVIFPSIVSAVSSFLGFEYPSNFVLSIGIVILLAICLSLSMVVSWQARYIRNLVQTTALLDNRISKLEMDKQESDGTPRVAEDDEE